MGMVDKVETTIGFRVQGEVDSPPCNSDITSRNVRGPYIIQGVHLNHSLFFTFTAPTSPWQLLADPRITSPIRRHRTLSPGAALCIQQTAPFCSIPSMKRSCNIRSTLYLGIPAHHISCPVQDVLLSADFSCLDFLRKAPWPGTKCARAKRHFAPNLHNLLCPRPISSSHISQVCVGCPWITLREQPLFSYESAQPI